MSYYKFYRKSFFSISINNLFAEPICLIPWGFKYIKYSNKFPKKREVSFRRTFYINWLKWRFEFDYSY